MKYELINNEFRKILNEYPGLAGKLKLPNTVILQFRKDSNKMLSISTFTKLIEGLGLQYEIKIKDKNGNEMNFEKIKSLAAEIAGHTRKKTLATIAGVGATAEAADKKDEKLAADLAAAEAALEKIETQPLEVNAPENESPELAASQNEVEVDLSEIFGTEGL